jgi:hypothetical protein
MNEINLIAELKPLGLTLLVATTSTAASILPSISTPSRRSSLLSCARLPVSGMQAADDDLGDIRRAAIDGGSHDRHVKIAARAATDVAR